MQAMNVAIRKPDRWKRILFRTTVIIATLCVAGFVGFRYLTAKPANASQILAGVLAIDPETSDRALQQHRAAQLAILGRDDLVKNSRIDLGFEAASPAPSAIDLAFEFRPWQQAIAEVAANERLVMISEGHLLSEHRSFIAAALPKLAKEGFTHYSAEAISEPAFMLRLRGYANHQTGFYTADPAFGNVIRTALDAELIVAGYDFRPFDHNTREQYAAKTLAKILSNTNNKLLVHAGPGHVLKHETKLGNSWLAHRLWVRSGVEPLTIYQISDLNSPVHSFLSTKVKAHLGKSNSAFNEPVVWQPQPAAVETMRDAGYSLPLVDLFLIHPPLTDEGATNRSTLIPNLKTIDGQWTGIQPVVIGAYSKGEPVEAIPLDQCMLQKGESSFRLFVPEDDEHEIRVFGVNGQLKSLAGNLIIAK